MGTKANIPATVTDCSVLVIGVRDCSSSIARQVDLRSINSEAIASHPGSSPLFCMGRSLGVSLGSPTLEPEHSQAGRHSLVSFLMCDRKRAIHLQNKKATFCALFNQLYIHSIFGV